MMPQELSRVKPRLYTVVLKVDGDSRRIGAESGSHASPAAEADSSYHMSSAGWGILKKVRGRGGVSNVHHNVGVVSCHEGCKRLLRVIREKYSFDSKQENVIIPI